MARTFNLKSFLIASLRRASYRTPMRQEALKIARIERGLYSCALCKGTFKRNEVHVDHILPVVDPKTGFTDWNTYIDRMFCPPDGLQIVCVTCHTSKTLTEKNLRKKYLTKRKKKDKIKS